MQGEPKKQLDCLKPVRIWSDYNAISCGLSTFLLTTKSKRGITQKLLLDMDVNTTNRIPVFLLSLLLAVAFDSMWGFVFRNGYYDALVRLRDIGAHLLPGSNTPLQEHYIGVGPIDYWLTVLQAVFANIFDGSAPQLSIYAFCFAGQLIPVITVMCIEGCRVGNEGNIMSL